VSQKISLAVISVFAIMMGMNVLVPEVLAEETSEIIKDEKNNFSDGQLTVQINENFFEDVISYWPFLILMMAGIVGGIIVVKFKIRKSPGQFSQDIEYVDNSWITDAPLTENFQDMQADSQNYQYALDAESLIESRVRMILKLQENKIGDYDRLEFIKKSLIIGGSFALEDNIYLGTKYDEYKKIVKEDSKEVNSINSPQKIISN